MPSATKASIRTIPSPSAGTTPIESSPAARWPNTCVSPCATGTRSTGTASTSSEQARSTARGSRPSIRRRSDGRRPLEDGRRVRVRVEVGRAVLLLPRSRHRPGGCHVRRVLPQPRRDGRAGRRAPGAHRREAAVGYRQPVLEPAIPGRRGDEPRPRAVRVRRRADRALHGGDAPAGRSELRAVGRAGGLRDAAQHRHAPRDRPARPVLQHGRRAQVRDRVRGHDPDRAEAVRADQAPVRLRRRRGPFVPDPVRARERGEGQHRGQPRHAVGPRLPPRGGRRVRQRDLRLDRRQRRRRPARLGPRPVPGVGRADVARDARDPAAAAGSRPVD